MMDNHTYQGNPYSATDYYDDYFEDSIDDYDNDEYLDFEEEYNDGVYLNQEVGCLPVFLSVIGVSLILILIFSRMMISSPILTESEVIPGESDGYGTGSIATLFTPEVQYWSGSIAKWSQQTGINANFIATVMQIESCGDPFAESSAGAMGLFQVMPYHFESNEDPFKPATNALRGLAYLEQALAARDGVVRLGFAGYNGGITGAKRPESQWPNETQRYVYWGTGIYEDAIKGKADSARLDEWLNRGGASLCKQAADRLGIHR